MSWETMGIAMGAKTCRKKRIVLCVQISISIYIYDKYMYIYIYMCLLYIYMLN